MWKYIGTDRMGCMCCVYRSKYHIHIIKYRTFFFFFSIYSIKDEENFVSAISFHIYLVAPIWSSFGRTTGAV